MTSKSNSQNSHHYQKSTGNYCACPTPLVDRQQTLNRSWMALITQTQHSSSKGSRVFGSAEGQRLTAMSHWMTQMQTITKDHSSAPACQCLMDVASLVDRQLQTEEWDSSDHTRVRVAQYSEGQRLTKAVFDLEGCLIDWPNCRRQQLINDAQ